MNKKYVVHLAADERVQYERIVRTALKAGQLMRPLLPKALQNKVSVKQDADVWPARSVKIGDKLDIDNGATIWEVVVQRLSDVRGSATLAQTLYSETEASIARRQREAEQRRFFTEPGALLKGRPIKRNRRLPDRSKSYTNPPEKHDS